MQGLQQNGRKTRVFISYSRKDLAIADQIDAHLKENGFDVLIDRQEIFAFEDWWRRIEALIASADTIVFILSPESASSPVCRREVEFAVNLNKRLAPIVYRRGGENELPETLRNLNFIFFDNPAQFDLSMRQLVDGLSTDIEWIRRHTDIGRLTADWQRAGKPAGLLLRSPTLEQAEAWVATRPAAAPMPGSDLQAFIAASRSAVSRRQRRMVVGAIIVATMAVGLSAVAWVQRELARTERDRAFVSQSRFLAQRAQELADKSDVAGAVLLALEALPEPGGTGSRFGASRPVVPEVEYTLSKLLAKLRERVFVPSAAGEPEWRELKTLARFSSDGRFVAEIKERVTEIISTSNRTRVALIDSATGRGPHVAFDRAAERAAAVDGSGEVRVVTLRDGQQVVALRLGLPVSEGMLGFTGVTFAPDGRHIATTSGDRVFRIWGLDSPDRPISERNLDEVVLPLGYGALAKSIVVLSEEHDFILLDAGTLAEVSRHKALGQLSAVALSETGTMIALASSVPDVIELRDVTTGSLIRTLVTTENTGGAQSIMFESSGKRLVSGHMDGAVRVWSTESGQLLVTYGRHALGVLAAAFHTESNEIISIGNDGSYRRWIPEADFPLVLLASAGRITSLAFSRDERLLAASSDDGQLRVWSVESRKLLHDLSAHPDGMTRVLFSDDGSKVLTFGWEGSIKEWSVADGTVGRVMTVTGAVRDAALSPDGDRLAIASDGEVTIWSLATARKLETYKIVRPGGSDVGIPKSVAWSLDGKWLAASESNSIGIVVWRVDGTSDVPPRFLSGKHSEPIGTIAFSADSQRLLSLGGDYSAQLWSTRTWMPEGRYLTGVRGPILPGSSQAAFPAIGSRTLFAFAAGDKAELVDVATLKPIAGVQLDPGEEFTSMALRNDGRSFAAGTARGRVLIWRIYPDTAELVREARGAVGRCLTYEWREYAALDEAPPEWCVEENKWPYHTENWKAWLTERRAGRNAKLPSDLR